jgi:cytochrome c biogenesis protein CcmG, thiol:disulfide interchange protein DsbE
MRGALAAVSLLWVILTLLPASGALAAPDVGGPAPAFVAQELNGQTFDLAAQRGKVVIVNFWATWCPPCRKEMPGLDSFYRKYHPQGLEMIGVSLDRPRDGTEVRNVMQSFSYPAAILDDAKVNDFGTPTALPVTFIIDRKGIVSARLTPDETAVTEQSLAKFVLPLLGQKGAAR